MSNQKRMETKKLVLASLLIAIVFVMQFAGATIRFGMFSISLVLIPIVIGAATCGKGVGATLGFAFGLAVLLSGDANAFFAFSFWGTVITVIAKGVACGFVAALVYESVLSAMKKRTAKKIDKLVENGILCDNCKDGMLKFSSANHQYVAVMAAAVVCPIVNTGVFLLGCLTFFFNDVMPKDANTWEIIKFMVFVLVGGNFLFELGSNIILSPTVVRLLNIRKKKN